MQWMDKVFMHSPLANFTKEILEKEKNKGKVKCIWKMETFIEVAIKMIAEMELAFLNILALVNNMKENGKIISSMVMVHSFLPMETDIKVIGLKIKELGLVKLFTLITTFMKETLRMTLRMEKEF